MGSEAWAVAVGCGLWGGPKTSMGLDGLSIYHDMGMSENGVYSQ